MEKSKHLLVDVVPVVEVHSGEMVDAINDRRAAARVRSAALRALGRLGGVPPWAAHTVRGIVLV